MPVPGAAGCPCRWSRPFCHRPRLVVVPPTGAHVLRRVYNAVYAHGQGGRSQRGSKETAKQLRRGYGTLWMQRTARLASTCCHSLPSTRPAQKNKDYNVPKLTDLGYDAIKAPMKVRHRKQAALVCFRKARARLTPLVVQVLYPGGETAGLQRMKDNLKRQSWIASFEKPKTRWVTRSTDVYAAVCFSDHAMTRWQQCRQRDHAASCSCIHAHIHIHTHTHFLFLQKPKRSQAGNDGALAVHSPRLCLAAAVSRRAPRGNRTGVDGLVHGSVFYLYLSLLPVPAGVRPPPHCPRTAAPSDLQQAQGPLQAARVARGPAAVA